MTEDLVAHYFNNDEEIIEDKEAEAPIDDYDDILQPKNKQSLRNEDGRRNALTSDTNIELILAGRTKKYSIPLPQIERPRHRIVDRIYINVDRDYRHLLGEVTSEKYNIHGRPELDLIEVSYKKPLPDGKEDPHPYVQLLFYSSQSTFVISQKVEDRLLYKLREMQNDNELILRSSEFTFGTDGRHHGFNTLDRVRNKVWRRFLREFISPLLGDSKRMEALDLRLKSNLVFIDEPLSDDNSSTTASVKPKLQRKKTSKRNSSGRGSNKERKTRMSQRNVDVDESDSDEEKKNRPSNGYNNNRLGSGGKRPGSANASRPNSAGRPGSANGSRPNSAGRPGSANASRPNSAGRPGSANASRPNSAGRPGSASRKS